MSDPRGVILLDVPGLTPGLLSERTPALSALAQAGSMAPLECPFPAVTLTSQASMLTGRSPREHGIVGNGWYWRELEEVLLWRQSHRLLLAEDLPTRLRRDNPGCKVAKLFWWFNMYAPVDAAVTPRPLYPADGRKIPDLHTQPPSLRHELQDRFGPFPLFRFWGPAADLTATRWIADASLYLIAQQRPDLSLVYLPHLDYDFQRYGPRDERSLGALADLDGIVSEFAALARTLDLHLAIVSEYGITEVSRPVHPNRLLRQEGLLSCRDELGTERPDLGASRAFAVADHQVAHVYVRSADDVQRVRQLLAGLDGVDQVLGGSELSACGLDHERSGELVLVSEPDAWFTYYFWEEDRLAPDYARTVDIHRKPGYDPVELFLDPHLRAPKLRIARRLLARKLGFRNLLDVIGLDATLVRGSHGRNDVSSENGPILVTSAPVPDVSEQTPFPLASLPSVLARLSGFPLRED